MGGATVVVGASVVVGATVVVGASVVVGATVVVGAAVVVVGGRRGLVVVVTGLVVVVVGRRGLVVVVVALVVVVAVPAVVGVPGLVVVVEGFVVELPDLVVLVVAPAAAVPGTGLRVRDALALAPVPLVAAATAGVVELAVDDVPGAWLEGGFPVVLDAAPVSRGAVEPREEAAAGVGDCALVAIPANDATATVTASTTATTTPVRSLVEPVLNAKTGPDCSRLPA